MKRSDSIQSDSGFTLIEVLVATFVMAILSAMGVALLSNTLRARDQIEQVADEIQQLELARAIIKEDVSQLVNRRVRDAYGELKPYSFEAYMDFDPDKVMSFVRNGHLAPGVDDSAPSLQYVEYHFIEGNLVRRSQYRLDATPQTPTQDRIVLSNVSKLRVSFHNGSDWVQSWATGGGEGVYAWPSAIEFVFESQRFGQLNMTFLTPGGY